MGSAREDTGPPFCERRLGVTSSSANRYMLPFKRFSLDEAKELPSLRGTLAPRVEGSIPQMGTFRPAHSEG